MAIKAWSAIPHMGTAMVVNNRAPNKTDNVGLTTTSALADTVRSGAPSRMGLRPMASASFPNDPESITSQRAEQDPIRPSSSATSDGVRPAARKAGGRAVPMQPKQADCKPAIVISSAGCGGSGTLSVLPATSIEDCPLGVAPTPGACNCNDVQQLIPTATIKFTARAMGMAQDRRWFQRFPRCAHINTYVIVGLRIILSYQICN